MVMITLIIIIIIKAIIFLRNYDTSVISNLSNSYHEASKTYPYR
jgi:hypothetical protein